MSSNVRLMREICRLKLADSKDSESYIRAMAIEFEKIEILLAEEHPADIIGVIMVMMKRNIVKDMEEKSSAAPCPTKKN